MRFFLLCLTGLACISAAPTKESLNRSEELLLKQISRGFSQVAKRAVPAVVYIESQVKGKEVPRLKRGNSENPFDYFRDDFFDRFFGFPREEQRRPETVRGSGILVSEDGYILTNNHIVHDATKILVTLHDGSKIEGSLIGTDPKSDLAVIKVAQKGLPFLTLGNSDALEVGEWAIAVGNPFGLDASVTVGVISAKGRNQLHINDFEDFIQTDAAINPGNSGGPLLNVEAEVIGINTAIVSGSGGYMGIGFAIPSNMAAQIMQQLIQTGSVTRGYLGIILQPIDSELAAYYKLPKSEGVLITEVLKDSPAEAAGLKQEDIVLKYNDIAIESPSAFRNALAMMPSGTKVKLRVLRDGQQIDLVATIQKVPETAAPVETAKRLGFEVQNLTPEFAQRFGYTGEQGVLITSIAPGSPAEAAGLQAGGLILAVNRAKVTDIQSFNEVIQSAMKERRLLLMVRQGQMLRFVSLRVD